MTYPYIDIINIFEEKANGFIILAVMKKQEFDMCSSDMSCHCQIVELVNVAQMHISGRPQLLIYCV